MTDKIKIPTTLTATSNNNNLTSVSKDILDSILNSISGYADVDTPFVEAIMSIAQYSSLDATAIKKTFIRAVLSMKPTVLDLTFGQEKGWGEKMLKTNPAAVVKMATDLVLGIFLQRGNNLAKAMTKGNEQMKSFTIELISKMVSSTTNDSKTGAKKFKPAAQLNSEDFTFSRWAAVNSARLVVVAAAAASKGKLRTLLPEDKLSSAAAALPAHFRILSISTVIPARWEENYIAFVRDVTPVITPKLEGRNEVENQTRIQDFQDKSEQIVRSLFKIKTLNENEINELVDTAARKYGESVPSKDEV